MGTLITLALLGVLLVRLGRRARVQFQPGLDTGVRVALAGLLVAGVYLHLHTISSHRPLRIWDVLPLHLCDLSIFLALFALAVPRTRVTELLFFWTTTGTLLASVTPAIRSGFPSVRYLTYFMLHGGVILAAAYLVWGHGYRPRKGAILRSWVITNIYAGAVLVINLTYAKNYLYLLRKPPGRTLLDVMGPWPYYILVIEGLALILFGLVYLLAFACPPPEGFAGKPSEGDGDQSAAEIAAVDSDLSRGKKGGAGG